MKTWKKLVLTEGDVDLVYSDRLERPVLACQDLSTPFLAVFPRFSPFFARTGYHSRRTAPKNLEERNRT